MTSPATLLWMLCRCLYMSLAVLLSPSHMGACMPELRDSRSYTSIMSNVPSRALRTTGSRSRRPALIGL